MNRLSLLLFLSFGGLCLEAQNSSTITISTVPAGARFYVDGQQYAHAVTLVWPAGSKHILEFDDLTWSYGDNEVIKGFTARVIRGEKIALMGRNGTGKTSLIKAVLSRAPGMNIERDGTPGGKIVELLIRSTISSST